MRFEAVHGFAAGNRYTGPAASLVGVAGNFSASVLARLRRMPTGREFLFGNFKRFAGSGGGWAIAVDADRVRMWMRQTSDGEPISNATQANFPVFDSAQSAIGKLFVATFVYDGTQGHLYVNGRHCRSLTPGGGLLLGAGQAPALGIDSVDLAEPATSCSILGAAYRTGAPSAADIADHARACMDAGTMVDASFANLWTLDGQASAPATLEDQIGSVDLTLTGALSLESNIVPGWL